jgi:hypothetical protein
VIVVAVAGGRILEVCADTAGLVVEACSFVDGSVEDVTVDIPEACVTASGGIAARSLGAGTHLAAAAAAAAAGEHRVHIGRCCMPAAASVDYAAGPWRGLFAVKSPEVAI